MATQILGRGNFATVKSVAEDKVRKEGFIWPEEVMLQKVAAGAGIAPKVFSSGEDFIEMEKVDVNTTPSLPEQVAVLCRLWRLGIAHGDLHSGNWGYNHQGKPVLIDFGLSEQSEEAVEQEMLDFEPKLKPKVWAKVCEVVFT